MIKRTSLGKVIPIVAGLALGSAGVASAIPINQVKTPFMYDNQTFLLLLDGKTIVSDKDGSKITFGRDGKWHCADGNVMSKIFERQIKDALSAAEKKTAQGAKIIDYFPYENPISKEINTMTGWSDGDFTMGDFLYTIDRKNGWFTDDWDWNFEEGIDTKLKALGYVFNSRIQSILPKLPSADGAILTENYQRKIKGEKPATPEPKVAGPDPKKKPLEEKIAQTPSGAQAQGSGLENKFNEDYYKDEVAKWQTEYANEKKAHKEDVDNLTNKFNIDKAGYVARIEVLEAMSKPSVQSSQELESLRQQLANKELQYLSEKKKISDDYETKIAQLKEGFASTLNSEKAKYEAGLAKIKSDFETERKGYLGTIDELKASQKRTDAEEVANLRKQLTDKETEYNSNIAKYEATIKGLRETLDSLKKEPTVEDLYLNGAGIAQSNPEMTLEDVYVSGTDMPEFYRGQKEAMEEMLGWNGTVSQSTAIEPEYVEVGTEDAFAKGLEIKEVLDEAEKKIEKEKRQGLTLFAGGNASFGGMDGKWGFESAGGNIGVRYEFNELGIGLIAGIGSAPKLTIKEYTSPASAIGRYGTGNVTKTNILRGDISAETKLGPMIFGGGVGLEYSLNQTYEAIMNRDNQVLKENTSSSPNYQVYGRAYAGLEFEPIKGWTIGITGEYNSDTGLGVGLRTGVKFDFKDKE